MIPVTVSQGQLLRRTPPHISRLVSLPVHSWASLKPSIVDDCPWVHTLSVVRTAPVDCYINNYNSVSVSLSYLDH